MPLPPSRPQGVGGRYVSCRWAQQQGLHRRFASFLKSRFINRGWIAVLIMEPSEKGSSIIGVIMNLDISVVSRLCPHPRGASLTSDSWEPGRAAV